jgi:hypothetical protein
MLFVVIFIWSKWMHSVFKMQRSLMLDQVAHMVVTVLWRIMTYQWSHISNYTSLCSRLSQKILAMRVSSLYA